MCDDHLGDDWAEELERIEDESRSDDPDLDAVDSYGFFEEQRYAAQVARRHRARDARRDMYRLSRHDNKQTPKPKPQSPLTTKEDTMQNPHPQQLPPVEGLDGPFQDQSGAFYVDKRNGQRLDARYVMSQLQAPPQPQRPPQGYPPQGYPQQGYPQQGYPPQGHPPPQPQYGMPGGRPMGGGNVMPPPQPYMGQGNTDIYGGQPVQNPATGSPADTGDDFDRTAALRRRNQPETPAPDHTPHPVGGGRYYQPNAAGQPNWDDAVMVGGDMNTATETPAQAQHQLRVTTETLAAIHVGGVKVPVSYNHRTHVALPLAKADGSLIDCLVPKNKVETMEKTNHMVGVDEVAPVADVEQATLAEALDAVEVPKGAVHTSSALEGSSLEQTLVMARRLCAENDFQPTIVPFTTDHSLCVFPEGVSDTKGDVAEALMELTQAGEEGSFTEWVKSFKALCPILVNNDMAAAARHLNRKVTELSNDILMRVLGEDVELDNGFQLDISDLIKYLNAEDLYLDFATFFMRFIGNTVRMEVGELEVAGKAYSVLLNCESGYAVAAAVDVTLQDGDRGICHPLKPGLVTSDVTEDLHEVCRMYGSAMSDEEKLPLYVYVTSTEGGWAKVTRSCSAMSAMDHFYVTESGC